MNLDLKFYQEIQKAILEQLEVQAAAIVSGKATDFADYRYRAGKIQAWQDALAIANEVNKRVIGLEERTDR